MELCKYWWRFDLFKMDLFRLWSKCRMCSSLSKRRLSILEYEILLTAEAFHLSKTFYCWYRLSRFASSSYFLLIIKFDCEINLNLITLLMLYFWWILDSGIRIRYFWVKTIRENSESLPSMWRTFLISNFANLSFSLKRFPSKTYWDTRYKVTVTGLRIIYKPNGICV